MSKKNTDSNDEQWIDLTERDPNFVDAMKEALEDIEPPPELEKKISLILQNHKKQLAIKRKPNNFGWLSKLQKLILFPNMGLQTIHIIGLVLLTVLGVYIFFNYSSINRLDDDIAKNTTPTPLPTHDETRAGLNDITSKDLGEIKTIILNFSDEQTNVLKEKIMKELKDKSLQITDIQEKADAMLSVSSEKGEILIDLKNVDSKVLWSKSFSPTETKITPLLLQDLFLQMDRTRQKATPGLTYPAILVLLFIVAITIFSFLILKKKRANLS